MNFCSTGLIAVFVIQLHYGYATGTSPVWLRVPSNGVEVGDKSDFRCLLSSNNSPAKVQKWEFNQQQIKTNNRLKIQPAHVLTILSAQPSDTGRYTCTALVNGHTVRASETLKVYERIVTYPMPPVKARIGTDATVKCNGEHFATLFWWKNDRMIQPRAPQLSRFRVVTTKNGSSLHITDVRNADNGTYVCEFIALRYKQLSVELLVEDPVTPSIQSVNTGKQPATTVKQPVTASSSVATAKSPTSSYLATPIATSQDKSVVYKSGATASSSASHGKVNIHVFNLFVCNRDLKDNLVVTSLAPSCTRQASLT
jgi:hypothetical protein